MKLLTLSATAQNLLLAGDTPFLPGYNAVLANLTASPITVQGSSDGTTYTTLATLAATSMQEVTLPNYIKLSAAGTAYALGTL